MQNKSTRGQVTVFIIIGILLVLAIGLLIYFVMSSQGSAVEEVNSLQTQDVELMIDNCIKKTGTEGLNLLGKNGNYIEIPNILKVNDTSYWIYKYANVMPSLNSSIDEFQTWFNNEFENCVDYTGFVEYKIETANPKSSIQYGAEDVIITLDYPINITRGSKSKKIDRFEHTLNVRYRRVYERARDTINAHFVQWFDYRNALAFVDQRDFYIVYESNDENNLVFTIFDNENPELETIYSFKFATNLEKSKLKRTVDVTDESLNFIFPFILKSPDNLAQLYLQKGVQINQNQLYVWQEYFTNASRTVTSHVTYTIKGGIKKGPKKQEEIVWNLTYPIYHFGPDGTEFNIPQRLAIFWDDEKNPNTGPMGILYRGPKSDYTWMPLMTRADYNNSFVYTDIPSFSEYTPLDCNKQSCKTVGVTSKNKPKKKTMCAIGQIIKALLPILIIILIIIIIIVAVFTIGAGLAPLFAFFGSILSGWGAATVAAADAAFAIAGAGLTYTAAMAIVYLSVATIALGLISVGMDYLGASAYDSGDTTVSFVPTCDQIVQVTCNPGGGFKSGSGSLIADSLGTGRVMPGTKEFPVKAGERVILTAAADKCKKSSTKCYSCSLSCTVAYK